VVVVLIEEVGEVEVVHHLEEEVEVEEVIGMDPQVLNITAVHYTVGGTFFIPNSLNPLGFTPNLVSLTLFNSFRKLD
jgi:hypothetical protein